MDVEPCILAFAHCAGEPIARAAGVRRIVGALVEELGVAPRSVRAVSAGGKPGKKPRFSWDAFEALVGDAQTGSITIEGMARSSSELTISLYLRHNPAVPPQHGKPPVLAFAAGVGQGGADPSRAAGAAVGFLERIAGEMDVLHGAATRSANRWQAMTEFSLTAVMMDEQPVAYRARWEFDARRALNLWQKARRLYPVTLLGPSLAVQAGGAASARAAGALEARAIAGSILVRATSEILDATSPEFLAATASLRRWLWPHTIQNPVDGQDIAATPESTP